MGFNTRQISIHFPVVMTLNKLLNLYELISIKMDIVRMNIA